MGKGAGGEDVEKMTTQSPHLGGTAPLSPRVLQALKPSCRSQVSQPDGVVAQLSVPISDQREESPPRTQAGEGRRRRAQEGRCQNLGAGQVLPGFWMQREEAESGRQAGSFVPSTPYAALSCWEQRGALRAFLHFFFFWYLLYKSQKPSQLPAPSLDGGNVGGAVKIPAASLERVSVSPRFVSVCSSSVVPVQPL